MQEIISEGTSLAKPKDANLPSLENISVASGTFYEGLLNLCLTPQEGTLLSQASPLLEQLPSHSLRRFYQQGVKNLSKRLDQNHALLEGQEDKTKYLLKTTFLDEGVDPALIDEIMEKATPEMLQLHEPHPGVFILETDYSLFNFLVKKQLIPDGTAHATSFLDGVIPDYIMVKKWQHQIEDPQASPYYDPRLVHNRVIKHETHHLLWGMLIKEGLVPQVNESSDELASSFSLFRDELAAYILSGDIRYESINAFVDTDNPEIQSEANEIRDLTSFLVFLAEKENNHPEKYLYPILSAHNFTELKKDTLSLDSRGLAFMQLQKAFDYWQTSKSKQRPQPGKKPIDLFANYDEELPDFSLDALKYFTGFKLTHPRYRRMDDTGKLVYAKQFDFFAKALGVTESFLGEVMKDAASSPLLLNQKELPQDE